MTVEAVIFDIGNVLIRWSPEALFDRLIGADRRRKFFDAVDMHGMNLRVDRGESMYELTGALAQETPDWADEILMWRDNWLEMASPANDHSVRLLRALRRRKVPVYALSNFGKETFSTAEANYPFLEEFDARFLSGEMGVLKPETEIYEAVEAALPYAPEAMLFTDDSADNIAAAAARGWQTHLFEGARGFADRLVAEGLLDQEGAA